MTAVSTDLSESVQALIDARLDTIDRMLLGRVPRQDRLHIVKEVEAQIHDLLQERAGDELGRDDVLAVLGRLDPPEAYLSEDSESVPASAHTLLPSRSAHLGRQDPRAARWSAVFGLSGLLAVLLLPLFYFVGNALENEILMLCGLFGSITVSFAGGILAVVLGVYARPRGVWGIIGEVTGVVSVLLSVVGGIVVLCG